MTTAIFDFFGLRENPFGISPDPRYLVFNNQARSAWDELLYGIQNRKGLLFFTGEVGTGKTTLLRALLDWLQNRGFPTALIFNSHLDSADLLDLVLADFGLRSDSRAKSDKIICLNRWLIQRYQAGQIPVLMVDEAQGLSSRVLEEIRLLLNLETPREKLLQIILAGQPELEQRMRLPELRQIRQRIGVRCRTSPLTLDQTRAYIQERLNRAGAALTQAIFPAETIDAVHTYSRGIPRVVNILCEHALINSYAGNSKPVLLQTVIDVASEFQFGDATAHRHGEPSNTLATDRLFLPGDLAHAHGPRPSSVVERESAASTLASGLDTAISSAPATQPAARISAQETPSRPSSASASPLPPSAPPVHAAIAPPARAALRGNSAGPSASWIRLRARLGNLHVQLLRWLGKPHRKVDSFRERASFKKSRPEKPAAKSLGLLFNGWISSFWRDWRRMISALARWLRQPSKALPTARTRQPHAHGQSASHPRTLIETGQRHTRQVRS